MNTYDLAVALGHIKIEPGFADEYYLNEVAALVDENKKLNKRIAKLTAELEELLGPKDWVEVQHESEYDNDHN